MDDECERKEITFKVQDIDVDGLQSRSEIEGAVHRAIAVQAYRSRESQDKKCGGNCSKSKACTSSIVFDAEKNKKIMDLVEVRYYISHGLDVAYKIHVPLTDLDPRIELTSICECVEKMGKDDLKPVQKKKYNFI